LSILTSSPFRACPTIGGGLGWEDDIIYSNTKTTHKRDVATAMSLFISKARREEYRI